MSITPGPLDDPTAAAVRDLAARIEAEDGAPPLSDRALTRLQSPDVEHLVVLDGDTVAGYAERAGTELEIAATRPAADELLDAAGGPVRVWSHGERSRLIAVFEARGFSRGRQLLQLRRPANPLPPDPELPAGVTVRSFEPGRDEDAWVAVNAAAFADHPEQGRVTRADLIDLESESWFDPAGFLLAERNGELVGYHWTKRHPDGAGEVYVLGIAPPAQGTGLGGALLVRGLRHLLDRGASELMLYVEADNAGAVHLYERQGFALHNMDVQWRSPG